MVSNSAKLDCRTKQHTESGVSMSDGSRDMARTRSRRKKKEKKKKKKNELVESHKASPTRIANNLLCIYCTYSKKPSENILVKCLVK